MKNHIFSLVANRIERYFIYAAFILFCISTTGCRDSIGCCEDYVPEDEEDFLLFPGYKSAVEQLCIQTMEYDNKYNKGNMCYYREVDRYIDKAFNCCKSLDGSIDVRLFYTSELLGYYDSKDATFSRETTFEESIGKALFFPLFILSELAEEIKMSSANNKRFYLPTNARSFCLLNTHPRSYQCGSIDEAIKFEETLTQSCGQEISNDCLASFILHNGWITADVQSK